MLLYLDNYGLRFSWGTLRGSVTTLADIALTAAVIFAVNIYFHLVIYKPALRKGSGDELRIRELVFAARRSWTALAFGCLLVGALALLALALSVARAWPMAMMITGVFLPVLFAEEYAADLFWNHDRVPDSVDALGIMLVLILSSGGCLSAMILALRGSEYKPIGQITQSFGKSLSVSLLTAIMCIAVALIVYSNLSKTLPAGKSREHTLYLTVHPPAHNILQNTLQFWGLLQFVIIPIALYVYHAKKAASSVIIGLMGALTGLVTTAVAIPIYSNNAHLRDLEARKPKPRSFNAISYHILFINYSVGAVTFVALVWLWVATLAAL